MKLKQLFIYFIFSILLMSKSSAQYLPLYKNIPNYIDTINEEVITHDGILRIGKVSIPGYQYFRVANDQIKRPCIIICPGGGYGILAATHEGTDVAAYFNTIGINAIVLKYRIPNSAHQVNKSIAPLQDAQQAIYLARTNASEWGIDRAALGFVLSAELAGMAVGSLLLGSLADRIGRRPTVLGCVTVMAIGMYMASTAHDVYTLSLWRVFTGLGIGGVLAAINAVAAEYSNAKNRNFSVSLMSVGYPLGAVLGGLVATELLKSGDWRPVFHFGAVVTAAFLPIIWFFVPESVSWLATKQPAGALERIKMCADCRVMDLMQNSPQRLLRD
jgi:MFS family permease